MLDRSGKVFLGSFIQLGRPSEHDWYLQRSDLIGSIHINARCMVFMMYGATYINHLELFVEIHVEVETLVDDGPLDRVFRVESVIFGVLVDEVAADGAALVQSETVIDDRWDGVLRIDLDEFGSHLLAHHQVDHFKIQLDSDHLGGQPD